MNKMMAIIASLSNETVDGQMSKNHKRYTTGVKQSVQPCLCRQTEVFRRHRLTTPIFP